MKRIMSISTLATVIAMMTALSCTEEKPEPQPTPEPSKTRTMTVKESVEIDHVEGSFCIEVEANFEYWADPQV